MINVVRYMCEFQFGFYLRHITLINKEAHYNYVIFLELEIEACKW